MTKFNPKTRTMPDAEYEAILDRMNDLPDVVEGGEFYYGMGVIMADSDFLPTQSMHEARFIYMYNVMDSILMVVDGAGDAIVMRRA